MTMDDVSENLPERKSGSQLISAMKAGATEKAIMQLITSGVDVNEFDSTGISILSLAIKSHYGSTVIDELILAGANVRYHDKYGSSALHHAAVKSSMEIISSILSAGADVSQQDMNNKTPIQIASENGGINLEMFIKGMKSADSDLETCFEKGYTPLHFASKHGTVQAVRELISSKVNLESKDDKGNTPLMIAAENATSLEIVSELLSAGANVNASNEIGLTALHLSALNDASSKLISALIEAGADPRAEDNNENSPLHMAALCGEDAGVTEQLLSAGSYVRNRNDDGHTPLHLAIRSGADASVVQELANYEADVAPYDYDGNYFETTSIKEDTPLHLAIRLNASPSVIERLLAFNPVPNRENYDGYSPFQLAACLGSSAEVISLLLSYGEKFQESYLEEAINPHAIIEALENNYEVDYYDDEILGYDAYDFATQYGFEEKIVDCRLDQHCDILSKGKNGNTLLHFVCGLNGYLNVSYIRRIIGKGADVNAKNDLGETPLHIISKRTDNHQACEASIILLRSGADIHAQSSAGNTPLHNITGCFDQNKENISFFNSFEGYTMRDTSLRLLSHFLRAGASIFSINKDGKTPLHYAAGSYFPTEILRKMLCTREFTGSTRKDESNLIAYIAKNPRCDEDTIQLLSDAGVAANIDILKFKPAQEHNTEKERLIGKRDLKCDQKQLDYATLEQYIESKSIPKQYYGQYVEGDTSLHLACKLGCSEEVIEEIINKGYDVNASNSKGNTPLHCIVKYNMHRVEQNRVTCILLDSGADIDVTNNEGHTPLHLASGADYSSDAEILQTLLSRGAEMTKKCKIGNLPIHYAATLSDSNALRALLQCGAEVNDINNNGETPLHYATKKYMGGDALNTVTLLLLAGVDVNARDNRQRTPLHNACMKDYDDLVNTLICYGANTMLSDNNGDTALHHAAHNSNNPEIVSILLGTGVDILAANKDGETSFQVAVNQAENNELLQEFHVGMALLEGKTGATHLFNALHRQYSSEIVLAMIQSGADLDSRDTRGNTPLHIASITSSGEEIIKAMLVAGADFQHSNYEGEIPLHYACRRRNMKSIELLIRFGSSVRATDQSGCTPLHYAASFQDNVNVIRFLISKGAEIHAADENGDTPYHLAAVYQGSIEIFRELIISGANANEKNNKGCTPLHIYSKDIRYDYSEAEVLSLMLNGYDIETTDNEGHTVLHNICGIKDATITKSLREILSSGANPNCKDKIGETPFHKAARNTKDPEVILALIDAGAKKTLSSNDGTTPKDLIVENKELMRNSDLAKKLK